MLELIVYPKGEIKKLINPSPFCAKVEILLRVLKIEHKIVEFRGNPAKFPNKKLPVINDNGKIIADSSIIQNHLLKKAKANLDFELSAEQKAIGFTLQKMIEEYYYWSLLHERWFIDSNWQKLKEDYFSHIPKLIRGMVTNLVRKSTRRNAEGHGLSRHSDDHVLNEGRKCIRVIANLLGDKKYIFGNTLSSFDIVVYAFIASTIHSPLGPEFQKEVNIHENLINYDKHMYSEVFGL